MDDNNRKHFDYWKELVEAVYKAKLEDLAKGDDDKWAALMGGKVPVSSG